MYHSRQVDEMVRYTKSENHRYRQTFISVPLLLTRTLLTRTLLTRTLSTRTLSTRTLLTCT